MDHHCRLIEYNEDKDYSVHMFLFDIFIFNSKCNPVTYESRTHYGYCVEIKLWERTNWCNIESRA